MTNDHALQRVRRFLNIIEVMLRLPDELVILVTLSRNQHEMPRIVPCTQNDEVLMRVGGRLNGVGEEVPESPDQDREDTCEDQHGFQAGGWPW